MIALIRLLAACGIAIFGIHYMMQFSRINEVTGAVGGG